MRSVRVAAAGLAALAAFGGATAQAAVTIDEERVTVTGDGAGAVVQRAPFALSFRDGDGEVVLADASHPLPVTTPQATANLDPEPTIGIDTLPETSAYGPLAFEVGAQADIQNPVLFWTGNMLLGAKGGVVHHATQVISAEPHAGGARLQVATTDPARTLTVEVTPDGEGAIRVQAVPSQAAGIVSFTTSFASGQDEHFYGFGGRHNAVSQRGEAFYSWVEEEPFNAGPLGPVVHPIPGSGGDRYLFPNGKHTAYYPQNIFVSSRPYGFLLNQDELSYWRMAADGEDRWQVTAASQALDFSVSVGDARTRTGAINRINGRHRLAPEWSMGAAVKRNIHQGNDSPETQMQKITADIAEIERRGVPLTAYAYESWDSLPDDFVRSTNEKLEALGIKQIGYVRAYVNDDGNFDRDGTFQEAVSKGLVAKLPAGDQPWISVAVGPAALLDFSNPETVAWWEQRKIRRMLDLGFDGFMQDFGEQVFTQMRFHDGSTGKQMHNRYPKLFHRVTREILDRYEDEHPERGPIFMYTRSGFSGREGSPAFEDANFPGDEATDWSHSLGLRSLTSDMVNRAVSGSFGYTTDIGGYFDSYAEGPLTPELFTRWSQWAALSPFYRLHNSCCTNGTQMPWSFGEETYERWLAMAELHARALPYIRAAWQAGLGSGVPPTRPLWLAFPSDEGSATEDQQWMLGEDVLVAPVVEEGATEREVYFPPLDEGWCDPQSGSQVSAGGERKRVPAGIDDLPHFFRCGTEPF